MQPLASPLVFPHSERAYRWIQSLAIALVLVLAVGILKIGSAPYIAFAFCGSFLIFAMSGPSRGDLLISAALGLAFGTVYHLHHGAIIPYFGSEIATPGGFLGMGAVQVLASRWIWSPGANQREAYATMIRSALIPLLCMGSMVAVSLAAQWTPITYDRMIFAFDRNLGSPSWALGTLFRAHSWLLSLCGHVYNSLPLALSACLTLQWREGTGRFRVNLGIAALALGIVGFALYQICPVSGPAYLFPQQFPSQMPAASTAEPALLPISPRNGMPSLHFGWALLLFWNLRTRRILGPLAGAFLILTALATLGSGEHYLADLIVAAPLALAVQAALLKSNNVWRWAALTTGTALTLIWLIAFRMGGALSLQGDLLVWALVSGTIALPVLLVWRSEREATRSAF
ncbi:MAG TPA: phosphatase PAP2 family protein [Bryobacteraceae bacterium]|nr:phosphatase PAP2 family protein [Bryobacteraceae bacterium]